MKTQTLNALRKRIGLKISDEQIIAGYDKYSKAGRSLADVAQMIRISAMFDNQFKTVFGA